MSRSQSRGRDVVSTGRGGAGNAIRSPSRSKADIITGSEHIAPGSERGRNVQPRESSVDRVIHTGRGGAGNTRSPSAQGRAQAKADDALEEKLVAERRGREAFEDVPFSTGRGGAGNIGGSRSRSRSRQPHANGNHDSPVSHFFHKDRDGELSQTTSRSTVQKSHSPVIAGGRGGYGNIVASESLTPEQKRINDAEREMDKQILSRYKSDHHNEVQAGGRGGSGNIGVSAVTETSERLASLHLEEKQAKEKVAAEDSKLGKTYGHGGFGNYQAPPHAREVDQLQAEDGRRGRGEEKGGMMQKVLRSLSRAGGKDK